MCTDCFFILIGILFAGVSRTVPTALAIIIHSKRFFKSKQAKKQRLTSSEPLPKASYCFIQRVVIIRIWQSHFPCTIFRHLNLSAQSPSPMQYSL